MERIDGVSNQKRVKDLKISLENAPHIETSNQLIHMLICIPGFSHGLRVALEMVRSVPKAEDFSGADLRAQYGDVIS